MLSKPTFWCLISAILFGISPTLSKYLLTSIHPILLASLLYLGAGLATLPQLKTPSIQSAQEWRRIVGAIFFGGIAGPILLLYGISQVGAATSSLLLNMESVATAILGWLFFREHLTGKIILCVLLVTLGGGFLCFSQEFTLHIGALWIILACICWGLDNHYTATIEELSPAQSTCIKGLCAGLFNLLLFSLAMSYPSIETWSGIEPLPFPSWSDIAAALLLGALSYGFSITLYIAGAQQLGATRAQLIFATAPYFGLFSAFLFLQESIYAQHYIATFLMLCALVIQNRERHGHKHTHHTHSHNHWHKHNDLHHEHTHTTSGFSFLGWHIHHHDHTELEHEHPHQSDIHHRHH